MGSAGVAGSVAAGANVRAMLPLYNPAQWSRRPDVGATSLLLALLAASLLLALLACWLAGLLAARCWLCCWAHVRLGTGPTKNIPLPVLQAFYGSSKNPSGSILFSLHREQGVEKRTVLSKLSVLRNTLSSIWLCF